MINNIIEIIKTYLVEKLKAHHSLYLTACKGDLLEELIARVLTENGHSNDWQPDSNHTISVDMRLDSGPSFSIKSGTYDIAKRTLKFSGSRLGKHDNLENMVDSIEDNTADYYVCISRVKKEWSPYPGFSDQKRYYLFVFPANVLTYKGDWIEKVSDKGKITYHLYLDKMDALISPAMSHQLWTVASLDLVGEPYKLDIISA